ncbi:hypothetical protein QMT40_001827 [Parvibaculaceae bacterium PLY_AMNH_Bact1]|nr:hypothetical protein QMT40_001827 [Parvibaculaceae bacterium PLY_AMNH_Bact1]
MIYAQEKSGQKLHLVAEAGEEFQGEVIRKGQVSQPLCGKRVKGYRMTCNLPLNHACQNCQRVLRSKRGAA